MSSLPSRERGLKLLTPCADAWTYSVAPFAGAWIEIKMFSDSELLWLVAPFAGAWIEIGQGLPRYKHLPSLPSRERGLKFCCRCAHELLKRVAPFAGAWIEIALSARIISSCTCRSLRGSVD